MRTCTYLCLSRHHVFYFRWPIPKHLHPHGKSSHVKLSLGTREPRIALQLARILAYLGSRLLNDSLGGTVRYDEIRTLLKDHFTRLLDEKKEAIGANGRLSQFDRNALETSILIASDKHLFNGGRDNGQGAPVDRLIEQYGLEASPGSETYETLQAEFQTSHKDYCQEVLDFDKSLGRYDFSQAPVASPKTAANDATTLSDLIATFVAERVRGGNWTPRTEKENRAFYALLCRMVGDATHAGAVDYATARTVKEKLQKVPRGLNTNPLTQNLTLEEAVALDGVKVMQVKTINKHLGAYNALFKWAAENGYVEKNFFAGLGIKRGKSQPPSRVAFGAGLRAILREERKRPRCQCTWGIETYARVPAHNHGVEIASHADSPCKSPRVRGSSRGAQGCPKRGRSLWPTEATRAACRPRRRRLCASPPARRNTYHCRRSVPGLHPERMTPQTVGRRG